MFRGQSRHTIDPKGRLSLPARFRDALEADGDVRLILTKAPFDPCLHLYPLKVWEEYESKISALPMFDPTVQRLRRLYISPAVALEIDGAGRVRVPPELRDAAGLDKEKETLWAGMGRFAELWTVTHWDAATTMTPEQLMEIRDTVQEVIRV